MGSKNIASRLHEILSEFSEIDSNQTVLYAWSRVFKLESENLSEILNLYVKLTEMAQKLKEIISSIDGITHDRFIKSIIEIQKGLLKFDMDGTIRPQLIYINEKNLERLSYCIDILNLKFGGIETDEEFLMQVQEQVLDIQKSVEESDLDNELKSMLVQKLGDLDKAIRYYRITGIEGMRDALNLCAGSIALNADKHANNTVIRDLVDWLGRINNVISLVKNVGEIAAPVMHLFLK